MAGPLEGVRVLDASAVIAAPFGAAMLGDFGAEVIKVEMPGKGDTGRAMGPLWEGKSVRWPTFSRNKKTVTLDLRREEGKNIFLKLVEKSDIIFENFRTGTFDKWGLDYETLKKHNPGIILIRVTGYGQTGPYAKLAGFGTPATAFSGYTALSGFPDSPPVSPPISLADYVAGLYGAYAALMCLYYRDVKKGGGQEADVSLYEGLFRWLEGNIGYFDKTGENRDRAPTIAGSASPSGTYQTRDGKWAVLVCSTDKTFEYLAKAIGREDMVADPRFCTNGQRVKHSDLVDEVVINWFREHDWEYIKKHLDEYGAPVNLVYTMEDIFADPHYAARKNIVEIEHPELGTIRMPSVTPILSKTPGAIKWAGAGLGAYNEDVFGTLLGMGKEEIAKLREEGII
ncbi:Formyl-CoA transferase [uncultured delta proteobacterium]|uniref:Formyl-CoA transferase n=1 Tax=uncultured delta proteobacterium TaxID=34034 RepID=A0A212KEU5_9DELT|nr:Formyl-CoA transferase [uncultured delta proteobacterium]